MVAGSYTLLGRRPLWVESGEDGSREPDPLAPLARAARDGDAAATRRLCEVMAPSLLQVVRALLGPAHPDVEDLLQDSIVGVLRALPSFRFDSSVIHFARRVAMKRTLEARRRARVGERVLDEIQRTPEPENPIPREVVAAERLRRALGALLDELPPAQAETLALRVVLGHSIEETAAITGVPVNTVRSRLRLAKQAMRALILADPALAEIAQEGP